MKLQLVSPPRGAIWVRQGFAVFFKQPLAFSAVFASFMFALFMLALLPFIGTFLLLAALPLATLGFMVASRAASKGRSPLPTAFTEPLHSGKARLLALGQLGLAYAASTLVIMALSDFADGGRLDALLRLLGETKTPPEQIAERIRDSQLQFGLVLRFALAGLLALPFWHAPALVHWGGQGASKALFFSLIACWRNKGAFTVYALTWTGVIMGIALMANLLFLAIGQLRLLGLFAMPASLLFSTVFYVSLYFTFADCFMQDEDPTTIQETL
ncbi:MAG: BPSS1780 family membrane protein [Burkholderiaceae bacterium]